MEDAAGPAKRIKVEGGWSGQPETALPAGAANFLSESALLCPLLQNMLPCFSCACVVKSDCIAVWHAALRPFAHDWKIGLAVLVVGLQAHLSSQRVVLPY